MERKFKVGDRIARESDGCTGVVTNTDFYRSQGKDAPWWVSVKWDRSNSRSDRMEDGLCHEREYGKVTQ